jgi:hypothetical protein
VDARGAATSGTDEHIIAKSLIQPESGSGRVTASLKASAESREKDEYSLIETWMAVKGARRAFILTLDGAPRPTESTWERSETNFSEASFPKGHDSVLSRSSCIIASTKARL